MNSKLLPTIFALAAIAQARANGEAVTILSEDYKTTFSAYGDLSKVLSCKPGVRGWYPSYDTLTLKSSAVELGLSALPGDFRHDSDLGEKKDPQPPQNTPVARPYAEGCQLAIDKFKAAIAGKDLVEVSVHREVIQWDDVSPMAQRKINGDVITVTYPTHRVLHEFLKYKIGEQEFTQSQSINMETKAE